MQFRFFFALLSLPGIHHHSGNFHENDIPRKDKDWGLLQVNQKLRNQETLLLTPKQRRSKTSVDYGKGSILTQHASCATATVQREPFSKSSLDCQDLKYKKINHTYFVLLKKSRFSPKPPGNFFRLTQLWIAVLRAVAEQNQLLYQ